jgi:hypothetical protein
VTSEFWDPEHEDDEGVLRDWATELGVTTEVMSRLVTQRRELVQDVAVDPREWGLDLVRTDEPRRDVVAEFRGRTRTQGPLAESFLRGYEPLMRLAPRPLSMPGGVALDAHLVDAARLAPEAAADIATHLRTTLQLQLGRPLEREQVEHAVREAAWDHEFDAPRVTQDVLHALASVVAG